MRLRHALGAVAFGSILGLYRNIVSRAARLAAEPALPTPAPVTTQRIEALLFTMDAMGAYAANAGRGGPSGEIAIRESLVAALADLGADVRVATSDRDFERACRPTRCDYAFLVLDAWTWAAPGWKPKPMLVGREDRVFLLDFFGAAGPRDGGIDVPPERILTAFPTHPGNTFLGYALPDGPAPRPDATPQRKRRQGVIWGKEAKHYRGREAALLAVAEVATLHSTLPRPPSPKLRGADIVWHGHLEKPEWRRLLRESKFLLGLGDPLLGPSAVDAVAAGCAYIDPVYAAAKQGVYWSQHPFLRTAPPPYYCAAALDDPKQFAACARNASDGADLPPFLPPELTRAAHRRRVAAIFAPFLDAH